MTTPSGPETLSLSYFDYNRIMKEGGQRALLLKKMELRGLLDVGGRGEWPLPDWTPQWKQEAFLDSEAGECLYGGSAGSGKSDAALLYPIRRRKRFPGSRGLVVRKTYTDLFMAGGVQDRLIELLGDIAQFRARDNRWVFPDGGFIQLGHCPDTRIEFQRRYQGTQVDDLVIEEAGQWEEFEIAFLTSRVRSQRDMFDGFSTQIRLTANPGGPGHTYLKNRFVDPHEAIRLADPSGVDPFPIWRPEMPPGGVSVPRTRQYIPATIHDNKYLYQEGKGEYLANLEQLPEPYKSAYLHGLWDIFVGSFFGEWSLARHVVPPFEIPSTWPRIGALDWGYNHPFTVLWGAVDPDTEIVYLYRELQLRFKELEEIVPRILDYSDSRRIAVWPAGSDIFTRQRMKKGGNLIWQDLRDLGLHTKNVTQGRTRIHGWRQVRKYLQWRVKPEKQPYADRLPLLRIMAGTTPALVRQIPLMQFDPDDQEDMLKTDIDPVTGEGGDDAVDCLMYLLMGQRYIGEFKQPANEPQEGSPAWYRRRQHSPRPAGGEP